MTIIARSMRMVIRSLGFLLFLVFSWLKLKGVPIGETVGSISGQIFLKLSLIIYYFSWVYGAINDTNDQELVLCKAPNQGNFPWQGLILCIIIALVFGLLCFVQSSKHFSVILGCFQVVTVLSWLYFTKKIMKPAINRSQEKYDSEGNQSNALKLEIVWEYLTGQWQWYRFLYGGLLVILIIVMSFSKLPQFLSSIYSPIPPDTYLSLTIFFYVLTFEGWIWIKRVNSKISQNTVDYVLKKIKNSNNKI